VIAIRRTALLSNWLAIACPAHPGLRLERVRRAPMIDRLGVQTSASALGRLPPMALPDNGRFSLRLRRAQRLAEDDPLQTPSSPRRGRSGGTGNRTLNDRAERAPTPRRWVPVSLKSRKSPAKSAPDIWVSLSWFPTVGMTEVKAHERLARRLVEKSLPSVNGSAARRRHSVTSTRRRTR
jgi:hypothetical protein